MPFAMIAVTLLLICSISGIVYAEIQNVNDSTDNIISELMSVEEAIDDTERYIGSGLGRIINEISTDPNGGNLLKRIDAFKERSNAWMRKAFPLVDKGVTASLVEHDIGLTVENLRLSTDELIGGTKPCYLRTSGYADVEYATPTSKTVKRIPVVADGTSGLPFIVDNITRFELSSSGNSSVFTDLMTYQLSSLAQHRVINGYGAISSNGDKGTESIITKEDVKESFRNSLSIVESLCFRTTGDGSSDLNAHEHIDAAEYMISKDGYFEIDISQIVSQSITAVADQLVGRWLEFFLMDDAMDFLDKVDDVTEHALRSLIGTIIGKDLTSSQHYISSIMKKYGYGESDYRYIGNHGLRLTVDGGAYDIGKDTIEIEPFEIYIESPGIDIFSWKGWGNFLDDGILSVRMVDERMKNILNGATADVCRNLGSIKVRCDAFDDTTYYALLSDSIDRALSDGLDRIRSTMVSLVDRSTFYSPSYIALFNKLEDNRSSIFDLNSVHTKDRALIKAKIKDTLNSKNYAILDESVIESLCDDVLGSKAYADAYSGIGYEIDNRISLLKGVLTHIPEENNGNIKLLLKLTLKATMSSKTVSDAFTSLSKRMIHDIVRYQDLNTKSGMMDLDMNNSYRLSDKNGNTFVEHIKLKDDYDIKVKITPPRNNASKCIHNIDLSSFSLSPYTTVFSISVKADIGYSVESASSVLMALGWCDANIRGDIPVDMKFDITCISGWALAGVRYTSSTDIVNEAVKVLMDLIEPLLEPLRDIFKALKQLSELCSTAIIEASAYISRIVEGFYDKIMEPMNRIQSFVESSISSLLETSFDIGLGYQSFTVAYCGMSLTAEFRAATLTKATKSLCKLTMKADLGDTSIKAGVELKHNKKTGLMFKGNGEIVSNDWMVKMTIDPLMKFSKKILNATGNIRGVGFTATIPEIIQYDVVETRVSDIPAVGPMLKNIPLPIPGVKGSFDMGVQLKYNVPLKTGLMINEFESNPPGKDNGKEFVELYNASGTTIDLTGYRLVPGSNESKCIELSGTIKPMEKKAFYFSGQALKNSGRTGNHNGESITLYDPDENIIDSTPWKSDSYNDDRTWQRSSDGSTSWVFKKGSPGKSNGTIIKTDAITKTFIIDSLISSGEEALYRMGNHLRNVDDIAEFLKKMLEIFIDTVIEKIAKMLVSAAVFIELELTDLANTQHLGTRIALDMRSELIEDGLKWLIDQTGLLGSFINAPECSDPFDIVCNDTYLRTTVYTGISAPRFLEYTGDQLIVGVSFGANISSLFTVLGSEDMDWKLEACIAIEDCPIEIIPKKIDKAKGAHCDLQLISMQFQRG